MSGAAIAVAAPSRRGWRQRLTGATPYLLLAPGLLWLVVFFIWPTIQMFLMSLSSGSLDDGFKLTWSIDAYQTAFGKFPKQMGNSLLYGGLATIFDFLIGFPVAYTVAFRGGPLRYADAVGIPNIVASMSRLVDSGATHFAPCGLLRDLAAIGKNFYKS